jgi:hypothetical protein
MCHQTSARHGGRPIGQFVWFMPGMPRAGRLVWLPDRRLRHVVRQAISSTQIRTAFGQRPQPEDLALIKSHPEIVADLARLWHAPGSPNRKTAADLR